MFVRVHTEEEVYELWEAGLLWKQERNCLYGPAETPCTNSIDHNYGREGYLQSWRRSSMLRDKVYGYVTED